MTKLPFIFIPFAVLSLLLSFSISADETMEEVIVMGKPIKASQLLLKPRDWRTMLQISFQPMQSEGFQTKTCGCVGSNTECRERSRTGSLRKLQGFS